MNGQMQSGGNSTVEGKSDRVAVPTLGLAVASLVLGILSIVLSFLLIGILLGIIGFLLGLAHLLRKPPQRAMAWWGLSLSIVGILVGCYLGYAYYKFFRQVREAMESYEESSGSPEAWIGVQAPDFTANDLDGNAITLSELKGRRVILDFWATWCPPCRKEIPHFIALRNSVSKEELVIIGISSEGPKKIRSFAEKQGMNYPLASATNLPSPYCNVMAIPTTFFIDRNGVIQNVLVGYHSLQDLTSYASGPDYEGTPKKEPSAPASGLSTSPTTVSLEYQWELPIPAAEGMCVGDWNLDGTPDVLVTAKTQKLYVVDAKGNIIETLTLPSAMPMPLIEYGLIKGEPVLLSYHNWGKRVMVINRQGKELWSYSTPGGVDGAHWGDLDGDGNDEMVVGMNGFGGLHGVDEDGKQIWKVSGIGNVWNQAVIPASEGHAALVFATEAGGTVRVFDGAGNALRTIRPLDMYYSPIQALDIDGKGMVQVVGVGSALGSSASEKYYALGFDPFGSVQWQTPVDSNPGLWRSPQLACGDIDGDGVREWAFVRIPGELVVVSYKGDEIACLSVSGRPDRIAIVSLAQSKGILVLLQTGVLSAFSA
jgi:peroxiredoxin